MRHVDALPSATPPREPGAPRRAVAVAGIVAAAIGLAGCSSMHSYTNDPMCRPTPQVARAGLMAPAGAETAAPGRMLATLDVDGGRGNPRVLVFLALSGGGSRSAYWSSSTMLALQTAIADVDLLGEVDVISAVSGGAMAGAHYASTRDAFIRAPSLAAQLGASGLAPTPTFKWSTDTGEIECGAPLDDGARARLAAAIANPAQRAPVERLCQQAQRSELPLWSPRHVPERMARNYQGRWIASWFLPTSIARYWTTSYDRADLMAQTLGDNLFDSRILGRDLTLGLLNPERPYLVLNATNASRWTEKASEMPFGSVFTFTREDFSEHLGSDIGSYEVARAVMGSSAFPVVFPAMTLADFRGSGCKPGEDVEPAGYLHVFDGGNSDNLGLKSIKRILLRQHARDLDGRRTSAYDRIVVILIDAFTVPSGLERSRPDPRGWFDRFLDLNVIQATDSLLQANRRSLIDEFASGTLEWSADDCAPGTREYPESLCAQLAGKQVRLDLADRLVFYHFGFADVGRNDPALKARLDAIPTAFKIDEDAAKDLDKAVALAINKDNACLQRIAGLVRNDGTSEEIRAAVREARATCRRVDDLPPARQRGTKRN